MKPLGKALRMGKGPQSGVGSQKQDSLCLRKSLGNPHTAPRSGAGANSPDKSRWSGKGGKYPVSLFPVPGKSAPSPPLVPPSLSVPVASPRSPDLPPPPPQSTPIRPHGHLELSPRSSSEQVSAGTNLLCHTVLGMASKARSLGHILFLPLPQSRLPYSGLCSLQVRRV